MMVTAVQAAVEWPWPGSADSKLMVLLKVVGGAGQF
jgi:hypothetical protein